MSFEDVLHRGDDFLGEYPRRSHVWRFLSYTTSITVITLSKLVLNTFFHVNVDGLSNLQDALRRSKEEDRGVMTVMNHMSVVDEPFVWGAFPISIYRSPDDIRWCLGAHNLCFDTKFHSIFFSLGQVLSTQRFGAGPFQGAIDASVRLLSPDSTVKYPEGVLPPIRRSHPSWVHVFPEGFILQMQPPYANSMRYFKWGITRMILESTRAPIVVPMFATGFEKIATADEDVTLSESFYQSIGSEINICVDKPIDDDLIEKYRSEWRELCAKYSKEGDTDLNDTLKYGREAQDLRSRLAAELREHVADVRHKMNHLPVEDSRFKNPRWWKRFTTTDGKSDPEIHEKFVGLNYAIKELNNLLDLKTDKKNEESSKRE